VRAWKKEINEAILSSAFVQREELVDILIASDEENIQRVARQNALRAPVK